MFSVLKNHVNSLMMGLLLGVLFLVSGSIAHAESNQAESNQAESNQCEAIDLRAVFPLRVRDQGDINWCYAHTAADYLQFAFKIPEPISAADIAIQYNLHLWPRLLQFFSNEEVAETGLVRDAMWDALENGYCPESSFPSDFWVKSHWGQQGWVTEKIQLSQAFSELFDLQRWVKSGMFTGPAELPFQYQFSSVSPEQFYDLLKNSTRRHLLDSLRKAACSRSRKPFPQFNGRISMRIRGQSALRGIHRELAEGMPVSIDYFYGVLEHPKGFHRKLKDLHTSLVMGQRFDPVASECQYLVKDSYGESCDGYDPEMECERGYLWVGESALRRALVSVVHLEKNEN